MQSSVCANPYWCVLCGLPIPHDIVSKTHPLAGTVEHLRPRSRGGDNILANRFPAHRLCNEAKGNASRWTTDDIGAVRQKVVPLLKKYGVPIKAKPPMTMLVPFQPTKVRYNHPIQRWEDDGGAIV